MAKKRRKARKPAAKRTVKASKRAVKAKSKMKVRKAAKPKVKRRAKPKKEGLVAEAVNAVVGTVEETAALRRRMVGRDSFEDT